VTAIGLLLLASAGCVDGKIAYRDGPNFTAPPTAAASFLGYSDEANKVTVCGNCHAGQQARWKETAHADVFNTLEASRSMQGLCQDCHTVSDKGNVAVDTAAGWRTTKDARHKEVQCESCHGAGLQHVQSPTRGQLLASIKADTAKSLATGCSECHSGTHHPFVEEWRKTRHATSRRAGRKPKDPCTDLNRSVAEDSFRWRIGRCPLAQRCEDART
jgi:protein-arginine kinase activator protein McsA